MVTSAPKIIPITNKKKERFKQSYKQPRQHKLVRSNSTSSLRICDTPVQPNKGDFIINFAKLIHKLCGDNRDEIIMSNFFNNKYPTMYYININHRTCSTQHNIPYADVFTFVRNIVNRGDLGVNCIISACIYLQRLVNCLTLKLQHVHGGKGKLDGSRYKKTPRVYIAKSVFENMSPYKVRPLVVNKWKKIIAVILLVASKYQNDEFMFNDDLASYCKVSTRMINIWETDLLNLIDFNAHITASEYMRVYFELRGNYKLSKYIISRDVLNNMYDFVEKQKPLNTCDDNIETIRKIPTSFAIIN